MITDDRRIRTLIRSLAEVSGPRAPATLSEAATDTDREWLIVHDIAQDLDRATDDYIEAIWRALKDRTWIEGLGAVGVFAMGWAWAISWSAFIAAFVGWIVVSLLIGLFYNLFVEDRRWRRYWAAQRARERACSGHEWRIDRGAEELRSACRRCGAFRKLGEG